MSKPVFELLKKPELSERKIANLKELKAEAEALQNTVYSLKNQLTDLTQKIKEVETTNINLASIKTLTQKVTKIEGHIETLMTQIGRDAEVQAKEEKLIDFLLKQFEVK